MSASRTARLPSGYRTPLLDAAQSLAAEVTCPPPPPPAEPAPKPKDEKPKKHEKHAKKGKN